MNPNVRKLPAGLLAVIGDSSAPSAVVFRDGPGLPVVGAVLTAGPSKLLPYGLVAKVTGTATAKGRSTLTVQEVPLTDAIPEFSYTGAINLDMVTGDGTSSPADRRAQEDDGGGEDSSPCSSGSPFTHSITADQFQIRKAALSLSLFSGLKESLTLALRTTESLGVNAQAAVACTWDGPTLWKWDGAFPGPFGIPIPVFGKLSVDATANLSESVGSFAVNLASTHVLTLDLGTSSSDDHVAFAEQGTNVWHTGTLGVSASASLGAELSLTGGFGVPKIATAGFKAEIGPEFDFDSAGGCNLALDWSAGPDVSFGGSDEYVKALKGTIANISPGWCGSSDGAGTGSGGTLPVTGPPLQTGSIAMDPIPNQGSTVGQPIQSVQPSVDDTYGGTLAYYPYGLTVVNTLGATPASTLPPGITINQQTGQISGTPTAAGTYQVTVMAVDSGGPQLDNSAQQELTWIVTRAPTTQSPNTVTVSSPGNQTTAAGTTISPVPVKATDSGGSGLAYSANDGNGNSTLPFGLTIDATTGLIAGQPAVAGTYAVTITVTDLTGASSSVEFAWTVLQAWTAVGASTPTANLEGVSCVSTSDCIVVGIGQAIQWNGSDLKATPLPDPVGSLTAVACVSATYCVAVGNYYNDSDNEEMLIEDWDGSAWTVVSAPNPPDISQTNLQGVSCVSIRYCTAVGVSYGSTVEPLIEQWNGSNWSAISPPNPAQDGAANLESVSCSTTSDCIAVGSYSDDPSSGESDGLIEQWNGDDWSVIGSPAPSDTGRDYLQSVSCVSSDYCTAVGSSEDPISYGAYQVLVEQWDGSSWSLTNAPSPGDEQNSLDAISCASESDCVAVGVYSTQAGDDNDRAVIEQWDGSSWSVASTPNPANSAASDLYGVSCLTTGGCLTVGRYAEDLPSNSTQEVTYALENGSM